MTLHELLEELLKIRLKYIQNSRGDTLPDTFVQQGADAIEDAIKSVKAAIIYQGQKQLEIDLSHFETKVNSRNR